MTVAAGVLITQSVLAAEFLAPRNEKDPNITISGTETHKNLYVAGANVNVNGTTEGDLYAAGAMVNIVGPVEQDLSLAGGSLSLSGKVGGDARIVGGNITINSPIGGDLLIAGGNLNINENATVGADAAIAGGNVTLNAPVNGSLKIAGGNISINSKITGDVYVVSNETLTFGPKAEVLGKITHQGKSKAVVMDGAKVSSIDFKNLPQKKFVQGFNILGFLVQIIAMFLFGWLLLRFAKTKLAWIFSNIQTKPLGTLGAGLLGMILTPIAISILFFTIIGYYIGLVLAASFVLSLMITCSVAALFLGNFISLKIFKQTTWNNWQIALAGSVAWSVLAMIPILGWLALTIVYVMAFGSFVTYLKNELPEKTQ